MLKAVGLGVMLACFLAGSKHSRSYTVLIVDDNDDNDTDLEGNIQ